METGTWHTRTVKAKYEDVFYEMRQLLEQRGWVVKSYQNTPEMMAEKEAIIQQGLDSGTEAEVIITHPEREACGSPTTSEAEVAIPIVITNSESGSIVATVGKDLFHSLQKIQSYQDTQMSWEDLTAIIGDSVDRAAR